MNREQFLKMGGLASLAAALIACTPVLSPRTEKQALTKDELDLVNYFEKNPEAYDSFRKYVSEGKLPKKFSEEKTIEYFRDHKQDLQDYFGFLTNSTN